MSRLAERSHTAGRQLRDQRAALGEPIGWVRPLATWLARAWILALLTPAILRLTARAV